MHDHIADVSAVALDRFAATPTERDGDCLRWLGRLDRYGYGSLKVSANGRYEHYTAHRIAYLIAYGSVPPGLVLDHLCHTRDCVNAAHLEPVTNAENLRRGRPLHQPNCKQGHPLSGDNLYVPPRGGRSCRECVRQSGRKYQAKRRSAA